MDKLEMAELAIKKGERTKLLYEMLLSELGKNWENTGYEVFKELQIVQDQYQEAIANVAMLLHEGRVNTKLMKDSIGEIHYSETDNGVS